MAFNPMVVDKLRTWKSEANVTYAELSEMTGINQRALLSYFNGERNVSLETACDLADAFGKSLDELVGRTPKEVA